jgi:hypothetical protein
LSSVVQTKPKQPHYHHRFSRCDSERGLRQLETAQKKFETTEETVHTLPDNDDVLVKEIAQDGNLKQIPLKLNKNCALVTAAITNMRAYGMLL